MEAKGKLESANEAYAEAHDSAISWYKNTVLGQIKDLMEHADKEGNSDDYIEALQEAYKRPME